MSREDYIEVKDRISLFLADYPEGSLQGTYEFLDTAEGKLIVFTAYAYRTKDDPRPGVGHAQEAFPGKTNFTRGSEIQNAETSAWGRAIAALGIASHRGVASAEEVRQARELQAALDQLKTYKLEILNRANAWAEEQELSFTDQAELVKDYLDAQGLSMPKQDTVENWASILQDLNERVAA